MHSVQSGKKSGGTFFLILFLTIFALGFGTVGVIIIHSAYTKEHTYSAMTTGIVIDYNRYSYNNRHKYSPIVEYRVGNQVFTGETNVRLNYRSFKEGESVPVFYNPKSPNEFYIKEYDLKTTYMIGAIFLLVGIGILVVFVLSAVIGRIKTDKAQKDRIQVKIFLSAAILFIFTVFTCLAGVVRTICIFAVMGGFTLFGIYREKRK